jgi:hypothetical protein
MNGDDLIRRGDALAAIFEAINKVAHAQDFTPLYIQMAKRRYEKAIAAVPAIKDDRIEALERERDNLFKDAMLQIEMWGNALTENRKLEAKLAKAIKALRSIAVEQRIKDSFGASAVGFDAAHEAEIALAEIEGGKDG